MTRGKPANKSERERFPKLAEEIGEDPARFLDHDLVERGSSRTSSTGQDLLRARIRGIDEKKIARAWIAVERRLDRGPRSTVLEWLEDRLAYLEDHGDREERLDFDSIPPREERVTPRTAEAYESMETVTPKPRSYELWGSPSERLAEKARAEGRTEEALQEDVEDDLQDDLEEVFEGLEDELAAPAEDESLSSGGEVVADD